MLVLLAALVATLTGSLACQPDVAPLTPDPSGEVAMQPPASLARSSTSPEPSAPDRVVLQAGGDVAYPKGGPHETLCEQQGADLFRDLAPLLSESDVNFANLESPFSDRRLSPRTNTQFGMVSPPHRLRWLVDAGFNLFSLANNHALDADVAGVADTIAGLRELNRANRPVYFAGATTTLGRTPPPIVFTPPTKRTRIGFVALWRNGSLLVPSARGPQALELIHDAAARSDVVIVSVHDGDEYRHTPSPDVAARNRAFVDAGARVVLGHHAHVAQGIERYHGGVIFHGLGNLSFATLTTRHRSTGAEFFALFARVVLTDGALDEVRAYPLFVGNGHPLVVGETTLPPRFASPQRLRGKLAAHALERVVAWSDAVPDGTPTRFEVDGDSLVVLAPQKTAD